MKPISKLAAIVLLAGSSFSGAALAQDDAKEAPPAAAEPRNFSLPAIETYTLENGANVTLVPYGRVPKVTVRAVVRAGNLNDAGQVWMADLTAAMMEEGAAGKSASEIAIIASSMGGGVNLGVGLDRTFAAMDVLSESGPDAVQLLADILQRPDFPESELARVKSDLARNLSIARTQPQAIANEAFMGALYPDHPYGRTLPADGQLEAYTLDNVKAFHAANFGGARTHIYVVGKFDVAEMKSAIGTAFGGWAPGESPLELLSAANSAPVVTLIDRPGAPQSTIRLGKRVPPLDGEIELGAMNTLLGGYFSSRITRNIREDKGYTYSPFSTLTTRFKARNWQQNADVTSEATGASLVEILKEIDRMRDEVPSDKEVQGIKNYMNGIFTLQLASRGGMAGQLAFVDLHGLGTEYLENYVSKIQALTAEDFQNAAADHLTVEDMSLVVVGPLDSVRAQLADVPEFADRLPE